MRMKEAKVAQVVFYAIETEPREQRDHGNHKRHSRPGEADHGPLSGVEIDRRGIFCSP